MAAPDQMHLLYRRRQRARRLQLALHIYNDMTQRPLNHTRSHPLPVARVPDQPSLFSFRLLSVPFFQSLTGMLSLTTCSLYPSRRSTTAPANHSSLLHLLVYLQRNSGSEHTDPLTRKNDMLVCVLGHFPGPRNHSHTLKKHLNPPFLSDLEFHDSITRVYA